MVVDILTRWRFYKSLFPHKKLFFLYWNYIIKFKTISILLPDLIFRKLRTALIMTVSRTRYTLSHLWIGAAHNLWRWVTIVPHFIKRLQFAVYMIYVVRVESSLHAGFREISSFSPLIITLGYYSFDFLSLGMTCHDHPLHLTKCKRVLAGQRLQWVR